MQRLVDKVPHTFLGKILHFDIASCSPLLRVGAIHCLLVGSRLLDHTDHVIHSKRVGIRDTGCADESQRVIPIGEV